MKNRIRFRQLKSTDEPVFIHPCCVLCTCLLPITEPDELVEWKDDFTPTVYVVHKDCPENEKLVDAVNMSVARFGYGEG